MAIERLTEIQLTALPNPNAPWAKDVQALGQDVKRLQEAIRRVLLPLTDQSNANGNPGGTYQLLNQKNAKNGYAGLDANGLISPAFLTGLAPALGPATGTTASPGDNTARLATTAFVQAGLIAQVPTGSVMAFAGVFAKLATGWLMCDGSAVSRTTYAALFAVIATNFGSGDGSTTFNLPDLRGKFPRGTDNMGSAVGAAGNDPDRASRTAQTGGGNIGNNVGSVQTDQIRSHSHQQTASSDGSNANNAPATVGNPPNQGFLTNSVPNIQFSAANNPNINPQTTQNTGGNETRPLNVYVNFIIKT